MRLVIDTDRRTITREAGGESRTVPLYSQEALEWLSQQWLRVGWDQKYTYTFSWFGRPIIQLPEDIVRTQEVIFQLRPDLIIETGVAHGGSLVLYASLLKAIGNGHVVGIDIEIRPHNRKAIEKHELASMITLLEGSSTDKTIVQQAKDLAKGARTVLVFLDSNHSKKHVLEELEAYSPFVSLGSYIVATDGIMKDLTDVPRGNSSWISDNPYEAAAEFVKEHPAFRIERPKPPFSESNLDIEVTHWPGAWIKRVS
ncbi:MAG TPA: CmcI family methyltransferase [Bdellovibrionota bacterium]|nr:CmcI family methyltransferase [Bdellovibrionota bacterium]